MEKPAARDIVLEPLGLNGGLVQTGGGTARLVSPAWVIGAKAPNKFEAGTPAIVNVIAFARELQLIQHFGKDAFQDSVAANLAATEILHHDELEQYSGRELLAELKVLMVRKGLLHLSSAELALIQSSREENVGGIAALGKVLALLQRIGLKVIQNETILARSSNSVKNDSTPGTTALI